MTSSQSITVVLAGVSSNMPRRISAISRVNSLSYRPLIECKGGVKERSHAADWSITCSICRQQSTSLS